MLGQGPKRILQPGHNPAVDETGFSVWNSKDQKSVIGTPRIVTPTGKFKVHTPCTTATNSAGSEDPAAPTGAEMPAGAAVIAATQF